MERIDHEISGLATELRALLERAEAVIAVSRSIEPNPLDPAIAEILGEIYDARRVRGDIFGTLSALFGEPAWDILLNLAIMDAQGATVPVKQAVSAACVPHATAHRHLGFLQAQNLIARTNDPLDWRRRNVSLTPEGRELMRRYATALSVGR